MADCTALPSCFHSWVRRGQGRAVFARPDRISSGRRILHVRRKNITSQAFQGDWQHEGRNLSCHCFGSFANSESLAPQWVPLIDQVLLAVSIVLAYMGGVVPYKKTHLTDKIERVICTEESSSSGRSTEKISALNVDDFWSAVGNKLSRGIKADLIDDRSDSRGISLSLLAIAESPRLRLLWITLERLHKEVNNASRTYEGISREGWSVASYQILRQVIELACVQWLEGELSLKNCSVESGVFTKMINNLRDNESMLEGSMRMGKSELYVDLLYFLRFGSLCQGHFLGRNFLMEHAVDILEDLVICLADGISCVYLELISIDSEIADEINSFDLNLCLLSTRDLQRIRNEVALKQWVTQNFQSVASMYEDRFDLFVLRVNYHEKPTKTTPKGISWWQRSSRDRQKSTLFRCLQISRAPIRVKRTKELRALTGWRYYYSLFLELSDVAMPLVNVVFRKGRDAVAFLLTCLVGRSLGLIYTGIRQALGFR